MAPNVAEKQTKTFFFGKSSTTTFRASLRKLGQKLFALPKFACSYTGGIEESTCDILGTFRRPPSDSAPWALCCASLRPCTYGYGCELQWGITMQNIHWMIKKVHCHSGNPRLCRVAGKPRYCQMCDCCYCTCHWLYLSFRKALNGARIIRKKIRKSTAQIYRVTQKDAYPYFVR